MSVKFERPLAVQEPVHASAGGKGQLGQLLLKGRLPDPLGRGGAPGPACPKDARSNAMSTSSPLQTVETQFHANQADMRAKARIELRLELYTHVDLEVFESWIFAGGSAGCNAADRRARPQE